MLKKKVTYEDFNGQTRTEDFYFNLTKAELMEMETSVNGGLSEMLKQVIGSDDKPTLVRIFKDLVLRSYGERSLDGKRFIKNDEIREAFSQTQAYSDIFMELATDDKVATEFIKGIVPSDLAAEVTKNGGIPELESGLSKIEG